MRSEILQRSNKVLTNNFTGDKKMANVPTAQKAIGDKFGFKIANAAATAKKIGIIPAPYIPRDGYELDLTAPGTITKHLHDTAAIRAAGIVVDAVLDDGTIATSVTVTAAKSTANIQNFLEFIKTNPLPLKEILIVSTDASAFNGEIELRKVSPFQLGAPQTIELNQFYDPYQQADDRITVKFGDNELELSDDLFMGLIVPAGATLDITFRF